MLSRVVALAFLAFSQAAPRFDVASVTPSQIARTGAEGSLRDSIERTPTSLTMHNVSLPRSIEYAYNVKGYQVSGPSWFTGGGDRFDVQAKNAQPASLDEQRRMLQALLAERFHLALHIESKPFPVYEMVVAKGGPHLQRSTSDGKPSIYVSNGSFVFEHATTGYMTEWISQFAGMDRPVLDKTGLDGQFDVTLKGLAQRVRDGEASAIFETVEDQLGLKLTPAKAPLQVLVIDHADKSPIGN